MLKPIGTTKGPGESIHEFLFITPHDQKIKNGEFVYYNADVEGQTHRILGRVQGKRALRLYPDGFSSDPEVPPEEIADMVGYDVSPHGLFEINVQLMGYYDEETGFVNPRLSPAAGTPIYFAPPDLLGEVLFQHRTGDAGSAHVGSLLNRPAGEVPVVLDVASMVSRHLAVIASTGAGKSYTVGVLIEELMKPTNCGSVVVIDPHGEANTLEEIQNKRDYWVNDNDDSYHYRPKVQVFQPGGFKTRVGTLNLDDLYHLLPDMTERMKSVLQDVYGAVQKQSRQEHGGDVTRWTLEDMRELLRRKIEEEDDVSAGPLIWRLNRVLGHSKLFDEHEHTALEKICAPGLCTVLQLSNASENQRQLAVAALLRRIYEARMRDELATPVFVFIEEAHIFAPAYGPAVSKTILKTILGEGRKFGTGVALISQRPGKLDSDALSQCNTQILMRIVNPVDQDKVAQGVEAVGRDLLAELPALTPGQAVIAGPALNTPVICRVRRRETPHGGESHNAPEEWRSKFFGDRSNRSLSENSAKLQPPSSNRGFDPFR